MRRLLPRRLRRLGRDRRGIAASEFALILPILVMFSAGTIEYSRLIMLTQKLQSSSFILADLTARDRTLSAGQLDNIFLALDNIIQPFPFDSEGKAIVTSIGYSAVLKKPIVNWQRSGAGTLASNSEVGEAGKEAKLPSDLTIAAGETIVAAEVYYDFKPLFGIGLAPRTIRRVAYYKPRLGALDTLLP
jgi:Flp pilus assembly protein TadG